MKQNKYPVLFLSNGPTVKYSPYTDFRAREFDAGIKFALAYGLLVNFIFSNAVNNIVIT